mmetsp:Transcript_3368/g.2818  ORF Transcript_3368/g.2818 Transcript_3368/m.2818 type:complete len:201 (+) Transcript_3368:83-685(+)
MRRRKKLGKRRVYFKNPLRPFDKKELQEIQDNLVIDFYYNPYLEHVNKGLPKKSPIKVSSFRPFTSQDQQKEQTIINQTLKSSDSVKLIRQLKKINSSHDLKTARVVPEIVRRETINNIQELKLQSEIEKFFNKPILNGKNPRKSKVIRTGYRNLTFRKWLKKKKKKQKKEMRDLIDITQTQLNKDNIIKYVKSRGTERK